MVNCQGKISVISGYVILKNRIKSYAASEGNEMAEIRYKEHYFFFCMPEISLM